MGSLLAGHVAFINHGLGVEEKHIHPKHYETLIFKDPAPIVMSTSVGSMTLPNSYWSITSV
jgi:hypothetical protein